MNFITNIFALFGMLSLGLITWNMADPVTAPVLISLSPKVQEQLLAQTAQYRLVSHVQRENNLESGKIVALCNPDWEGETRIPMAMAWQQIHNNEVVYLVRGNAYLQVVLAMQDGYLKTPGAPSVDSLQDLPECAE